LRCASTGQPLTNDIADRPISCASLSNSAAKSSALATISVPSAVPSDFFRTGPKKSLAIELPIVYIRIYMAPAAPYRISVRQRRLAVALSFSAPSTPYRVHSFFAYPNSLTSPKPAILSMTTRQNSPRRKSLPPRLLRFRQSRQTPAKASQTPPETLRKPTINGPIFNSFCPTRNQTRPIYPAPPAESKDKISYFCRPSAIFRQTRQNPASVIPRLKPHSCNPIAMTKNSLPAHRLPSARPPPNLPCSVSPPALSFRVSYQRSASIIPPAH